MFYVAGHRPGVVLVLSLFVMVETPAGGLFEDIQYEDIEVEAVNFPTVTSSAFGEMSSCVESMENSPGVKDKNRMC